MGGFAKDPAGPRHWLAHETSHPAHRGQIRLGYPQLGSGGRIQSLRERADDPGSRPIQSYLQGLLDTGQFPNLAELGAESLLHGIDEEPTSETGLDWLLTGLAVQLSLPPARS
jgi:hypothetical protein